MPKTPKAISFEKQLKELEDIVAKLEDGSRPLEESLQLFESGIKLSRELQGALQKASMKVSTLIEGEGINEKPFTDEETDPGSGARENDPS